MADPHPPSEVEHASAPEDSVASAVASRPSSGRQRLMVVVAIVLFLVGLLLVREGTRLVVENTAGDPVSAPGVGHIHGIGVNPADGRVYASAHRGVIQLSEQHPPVVVGDQVQGYDGFIVVVPNHFLASGHPRQRPWTFGLVESTDGGATWTSRSFNVLPSWRRKPDA